MKQMPSLNLNAGVDFRLYGRHLEYSIWRNDSGTFRHTGAPQGEKIFWTGVQFKGRAVYTSFHA